MNPQASEGFSGLLEWSGPVIFDRLRLAYRVESPMANGRSRLAKLHCRVWRALLMGDLDAFEAQRTELVAQLELVGLSLDCVAEADNQTMAELVEIVVARFRRSPQTSQAYHLALMQLAGTLRPLQAA